MLETIRPEKSAEWYGRCYEIVLNEDRYLQAAEYANKAVRMYLKLKQYENAITWSENAMESYVTGNEERSAGRQVVNTVIIHLARDDHIAAQKAYMAHKAYVHPDECYSLDQLFQGFDQFDNQLISAGLKSPFIGNLENEFVKIVRELLKKYQPDKSTSNNNDNAGSSAIEDDEAGAML